MPAGIPAALLRSLEKPGRYVGGEWNCRATPGAGKLSFVLAFPDVYEIGVSNLGLQILYDILNDRDDVWADRTYLPWTDAAAAMRAEGLTLASLERGLPLAEADILGVSLQHELNLTGALELLDLAGLPLHAAARTSGPLVLAGGPSTLNPEPMAPFFDAFLVGDGEEAIGELVEAAVRLPLGGLDRAATLAAWADIEGVYLPGGPQPQRPVKRRVVADLDGAPFPTRQLVPGMEAVHDRAVIEIMRGCTRGCRFCQAGYAYRPVRERKPGTVLSLARETLLRTGHSELSLSSLSSSDHSGIEEMLRLLPESCPETSFSLPSLRAGGFGVGLAEAVGAWRRSGLTFAPEAGTERLRRVINKGLTEVDLMEVASLAFSRGWRRIKLYFMIGLPTEREEDVEGIAGLASRMLATAESSLPAGTGKGALSLTLSISNFVPKPHTPFQWDGFVPPQELRRRFNLLRRSVRDKRIGLKWHSLEASLVEAALARGGRELAPVIESAWRNGAVFDNWSDRFRLESWRAAFAENGFSLEDKATATLDIDAPLPWDFIETGVSPAFLKAERERAISGECTPDCRDEACADCGVCSGEIRMRTG